MRQRVNIMRTLAYDPQVILMDEPFGPLDALTRGTLQNWIWNYWREAGKTIIFVTHDLFEAVGLGRRVCVMTGRPGKIQSAYAVSLPEPRDAFSVHDTPGFQNVYSKVRSEVLAALGEGTPSGDK